VELLLIRWLYADVRAFTVFKTFPLATCFVRMGVGYALSTSAAEGDSRHNVFCAWRRSSNLDPATVVSGYCTYLALRLQQKAIRNA
jgi:hypothetical protein